MKRPARVGASQLPPELMRTYHEIRPAIEARLAEFDEMWESGSEEALFEELAFCLFTPQSQAFACWSAVEKLRGKGLLAKGGAERVAAEIPRVRFRNHKARYLVEARRRFAPGGRPSVRAVLEGAGTPQETREWLVANVKGYGHKEASHFLRNIGRGRDLAILDRHILRNLGAFGVIAEIPRSLPRWRYMDIEKGMAGFSAGASIPLAHMDFLLWHKEAGAIFK